MNPFSKLSLFIKKYKGRFLITLALVIWGAILFNNFFYNIRSLFDYFFVESNKHLYLFGSCVIVYLLYYFIWIVPKNILESTNKSFKTDFKEYHAAVKNYRATNAQIIGGIFFLLTVSLTFTQIQNDKKANDDRLLIEQYQKAIDQLNDANIASRLGGIYSLEKIMNENDYYHWKIVEILTAYVREKRDIRKYDVKLSKESDHPNLVIDDKTKSKTYLLTIGFKKSESGIDVPIKKTYYRVPVEKDIQAILTVVGRRNRKYEITPFYDLDMGRFIGKFETELTSGLDSNSRRHLMVLENSLYSMRELVHKNSVNLSNINLYNADLVDTYFDISNCVGTHFVNTKFINSNFIYADMQNAQFENSYFQSSIFAYATCTNSQFENANFNQTSFYNAWIDNSNFTGSNCNRVNFNHASLKKSNVVNAVFTDSHFIKTQNITLEQFSKAKILHCSGIRRSYQSIYGVVTYQICDY